MFVQTFKMFAPSVCSSISTVSRIDLVYLPYCVGVKILSVVFITVFSPYDLIKGVRYGVFS